jgi:hypothetical protein
MTDLHPAKSENDFRAILYDAGGHDRNVDLGTIDIERLGKQQILWVIGQVPGRSIFQN